jgi:hypothetical protein
MIAGDPEMDTFVDSLMSYQRELMNSGTQNRGGSFSLGRSATEEQQQQFRRVQHQQQTTTSTTILAEYASPPHYSQYLQPNPQMQPSSVSTRHPAATSPDTSNGALQQGVSMTNINAGAAEAQPIKPMQSATVYFDGGAPPRNNHQQYDLGQASEFVSDHGGSQHLQQHHIRDSVPIKREPPSYASGMDGTGQFMRFKLTPTVQASSPYPPLVVMQPHQQSQYQQYHHHYRQTPYPSQSQHAPPVGSYEQALQASTQQQHMYHGAPPPSHHHMQQQQQQHIPDQVATPHIQGGTFGGPILPIHGAPNDMALYGSHDHDNGSPPDSKRRKVSKPLMAATAFMDEDDDDGPSAGTSGSNGDSDDELSPSDVAALEVEFNNPAAGPDETDPDYILVRHVILVSLQSRRLTVPFYPFSILQLMHPR